MSLQMPVIIKTDWPHEKFRHAILCPGTEEEINHLECYMCAVPACVHKDGSYANLRQDVINHPEKYPEWLARVPGFRGPYFRQIIVERRSVDE